MPAGENKKGSRPNNPIYRNYFGNEQIVFHQEQDEDEEEEDEQQPENEEEDPEDEDNDED